MAQTSKRVKLTNVRFSFLKVFKAVEALDGKKKFSTTILIPKGHPQVEEVKATIKEVMSARWPDAAKKKFAGFHNPLRDGDTDETNAGREGYAGCYFINASTSEDRPPQCVDRNLQPAVPSEWVSGDWGNVTVSFFDFDAGVKKGVGVGLGNVQFLKKGEPLAGGVSAETEFKVEEADDEDL